MSFLLALAVSLFTFPGTNSWDKSEWLEMFKFTRQFYAERIDLKLALKQSRNFARPYCKRLNRYGKAKAYGNCLLTHIKRKIKTDIYLLNTAPIKICKDYSDNNCQGVGGLSTGVCSLPGAAIVWGKRVSTHIFEDGGNAGYEMSRLSMLHETGHLLGASHSEDTPAKRYIDVMYSDALSLLWNEFDVTINGDVRNFRDALPLSHYSRYEINKCLKAQ